MATFTNNQVNNIVAGIVDALGTELTEDELDEAVGMLLEDISGCESLDSRTRQNVMTTIRNRYYDAIKNNP